jgi:HSP20 family protein
MVGAEGRADRGHASEGMMPCEAGSQAVEARERTMITQFSPKSLAHFDLFRDYDNMRRRVDEMFGTFPNRFPFRFFEGELWSPTVDVYQEGTWIVIKADLPGVYFKDVKLTLLNNVLTIEGERKLEKEIEEEKYYTKETWYGGFLRRIPLPIGTLPDAIKASFNNGVLEMKIPVPVETLPKEIPIKNA